MMSLVQLRRSNTGVSWGFRMNGGLELKQPLHVQKVTPGGVAHRGGLRAGDVIREICRVSTHSMSHEQAKMEIIRAGNELDFFVERNGMPISPQIDERQYTPLTPDRVPNAGVYSRQTDVHVTSLPDHVASPQQTYVVHRSLTLQ